MSNTAQKIDLYALIAENAPDNVVVNIGKSPILIGGSEHVTKDSARIDPGDRRQGDYYLDILEKTPDAVRGLVQLKRVPQDRLEKVENERQVRAGTRAPKWVEKARAKAAKEDEPPVFDKQKAAMVGIKRRQITKEVNDNQVIADQEAVLKDFGTGFADED